MTAQGAVSRQKERGRMGDDGGENCMRYSMTGFPQNPVILATLVITATGWDD